MKLNGKVLAAAAALVLGSSIAVIGCAASDDGQDEQGPAAGTEQAAGNEANAGTEKDWYRGGRGWGYGRGYYGRGWGYRGGRGWGYGRRYWWY